MPELPEVQTVVNDLLSLDLVGQRITGIQVFWRRSVDGVSDAALRRHMAGRTIVDISRRGKFIQFHLDDNRLCVVHLRMSGRLRLVTCREPLARHEHVIIALSGGRDIRYYDPRKFGRIYIGRAARDKLARLGAEPLDKRFTLARFDQLLAGRHRRIKPLLLDQTMLSGLGNIYTDEALWRARIHPLRISSALTSNDRRMLYRAIRDVLRSGIRRFGTSLGIGENNFHSVNKRQGQNRLKLNVYGLKGRACVRCASAIERILVAQRSTHICPKCQTRPPGLSVPARSKDAQEPAGRGIIQNRKKTHKNIKNPKC